MNAKFEKISYEKKAFSLSTSVKVECKTDVPAEGFGVIAISPSVYGESFSAKEKKFLPSKKNLLSKTKN